MSLKSAFKTDHTLETGGNWKDFGDFRVKIARGGGTNKDYVDALTKRGKRFLGSLQNPTEQDERKVAVLMRELLVEHCIKGWQTCVDGEWKDGIEFEEGKLLEPSRENLLTILSELPDLERQLQTAVQEIANFRQAALEEAAKN